MLIMHWIFKTKKSANPSQQLLVRVHVLSQLLEEFYSFMHLNLCAGVLQRRLFVVPFCRDVHIEQPGFARVLQILLQHCQRVGGVLIVAPEHRMSAFLKIHELRLQQNGKDLQDPK